MEGAGGRFSLSSCQSQITQEQVTIKQLEELEAATYPVLGAMRRHNAHSGWAWVPYVYSVDVSTQRPEWH